MRSCCEGIERTSGSPAVYLPIAQFDGLCPGWGLSRLREHGQYVAPAAEGLAVAVRPVHIRVQQGPEGTPVARDDRCQCQLRKVSDEVARVLWSTNAIPTARSRRRAIGLAVMFTGATARGPLR